MHAAVTASQLRVPARGRAERRLRVRRQARERVAGVAVQTERGAGVLDRAVGVAQQRRDGADLRALGLREQLLHPVR